MLSASRLLYQPSELNIGMDLKHAMDYDSARRTYSAHCNIGLVRGAPPQLCLKSILFLRQVYDVGIISFQFPLCFELLWGKIAERH